MSLQQNLRSKNSEPRNNEQHAQHENEEAHPNSGMNQVDSVELQPNPAQSNVNVPTHIHITNPEAATHDRLVAAMCNKLQETLSMNEREVAVLERFIEVAKEMTIIFQERAEIHCFLSLLDPAIVQGRQTIAPIYSKLFLRAIDRRNMAADSTSHAMSDLFSIAKEVIKIGELGHPMNSTLPTTQFPRSLALPRWLSGLQQNAGPDLQNISHIVLEEANLIAIERLDIQNLLNVYGDFFHYLWNSFKDAKGWKGKIVYEKLTPPWLRGSVVFLYGTNNSLSIPCKYGELPRKGLLKDKNQKIVGSAILSTWMEKERETSTLLRWFLEKKGVFRR